MNEQTINRTTDELQISPLKFMKNDMWVYSTLAMLLVVVGLYLFLEFSGYNFARKTTGVLIGKEAKQFYGPAIITLIPLLLIVFYWRFNRLKSLMQKSVLVTGKIFDVSAYGRGTDLVTIKYEYENKEYEHQKRIVFASKSMTIEGNETLMLVNREDPEQSLIKDLFFAK